MTQKDLKSGITKEYLYKIENEAGQLVDRDLYVDEYGFWHENIDGKDIMYPKSETAVLMHDARGKEFLPEEMRICGFWLKIKDLWIAPMIVLGYKNSTANNQVLYSEDSFDEEGNKTVYTETLQLGTSHNARVHVAITVLDKNGFLLKDKCRSEYVEIM